MVVDTNILIAYLAGESVVVSFLDEYFRSGGALFLSAVAYAETLSFPALTISETRAIEQFFSTGFVFVPVDRVVAATAARIRRETKIKMPDALIAATARTTGSPLLTRNEKDFANVRNLSVLSV